MPIWVDGFEVAISKFPGGEVHVVLPLDLLKFTWGYKSHSRVFARLLSSDDVMALLLTFDALRHKGRNQTALDIVYFPYARQDRVCNGGEALGAKVMAVLINGLGCSDVTVYDPHSDVVSALLDKCTVIGSETLIQQALDRGVLPSNLTETLVAPDAGAVKRVYAVAKRLGLRRSKAPEVFCAHKVRDTKTGEITHTEFHGDVGGKDVLIVDDICDGGATFIALVKLLREKGAASVNLYVTHGIFSKGIDALKEHIDHVYCLYMFLPDTALQPEFLTVFEKEYACS